MDSQNMKKAVAYVRVSTVDQAENGYSIDAQINNIKQFCAKTGYELAHVYADRGISGKSTKKRVQLKQMLEDIKDNKFDAVVVWKYSRLARNLKDLLVFVDQFERNNVAFYSVDESFDTSTIAGKMMLQILGSFAEMERNTIASNVKAGMKQRASTGYSNSTQLLGYNNARDADGKRNLIINEEEAVTVRNIYNWYIELGTFQSVADRLNSQGYRTKLGNQFSPTAIRTILINPTFKGLSVYNRYEDWDKKHRKGLNSNPIIVDGQHQAIITDSVWDAANARINNVRKTRNWNHRSKYLLSGLIRCPECDGSMTVTTTRNKNKSGERVERKYYSCALSRKKKGACHANSIPQEVADALVINRLTELTNTVEMGEATTTAIQQNKITKQKELEQSIDNCTNEITRLKQQQDELNKMLATMPDARIGIEENQERLRKEIGQNENTIQHAKQGIERLQGLPDKLDMQWLLQQLGQIFKSDDIMLTKQLIVALIDNIQIDNEKMLLYINLTIDSQFVKKLTPYLNEKALTALQGRPSAFLCTYTVKLTSQRYNKTIRTPSAPARLGAAGCYGVSENNIIEGNSNNKP
ncbi:recombinase family protein [Latilactobacillus sakei]|uniref:Recombinase family protein n=1 Tax=Latilactobacillus sakei TaxID=1599 RepID=A0AAF0K452_LATSK|nr:recombinase family protein [Latilactobacillus sakei]WGI19246.1 recombinase family protein [Latilactobacillus sakei]